MYGMVWCVLNFEWLVGWFVVVYEGFDFVYFLVQVVVESYVYFLEIVVDVEDWNVGVDGGVDQW